MIKEKKLPLGVVGGGPTPWHPYAPPPEPAEVRRGLPWQCRVDERTEAIFQLLPAKRQWP
ncbi:MAG: hypothetical protein WHX93_16120 [bacterium]